MDDVAANMIERATALADFDHAGEDFERVYSQVPEEALDYRPEGEDYSIRDIVSHVSGVITMYTRLLERIREAEYEEVRLMAGAEDADPHYGDRLKIRASRPMRLADDTGLLDELEAAHDRLAAMLRDRVQEELNRQAPVYYVGAEASFPTGAMDILSWVTDHYREHVTQVGEMVEKVEKVKRET